MARRWKWLHVSTAALALTACSSGQNGGWDVPAPDGSGIADATDIHDVRTDIVDIHDVRPDVPVDVRDVHDSGTVTDTGGGMCPSSCTTNAECQSACPAPPSGSSVCCAFGLCTTYTMPVCPATTVDSGSGMCLMTSCVTNDDCAGCAGGASCCFIGFCLALPPGFCPTMTDAGSDTGFVFDSGTVDAGAVDTGPLDVAFDAGAPDVTFDGGASDAVDAAVPDAGIDAGGP